MIFPFCLQGALLLWEQIEDTDHHSFHTHASVAGMLLVALRVGLALLLAAVLYQMTAGERSAIRKDFYLRFAKVQAEVPLSAEAIHAAPSFCDYIYRQIQALQGESVASTTKQLQSFFFFLQNT